MIVRQIILSFFLVFSFNFYGNAQVAAAPQEQTNTTADTLAHSLLWKISGNGLDNPSYLYGTIHIINKKDFFVTENTQKAIDDAERMTFEINMEDMNDMSALMSVMMNAFMKDGGSLKAILSDEDYALVEEKFKKLGLPLMMFDKVKPMFTSMMAEMDMSGAGNPMSGSGDVTGYETEFMKIAQQQKMEMAGLETIEYQMSMFDSIPYEAQAKMLVDGIKAGEDAKGDSKEMEQMLENYKSQNLNALANLISDEDGGIGEYEDILLSNRNKNWIPLMTKQMKEKKTFFAVGAGHLPGKQGVINLLKNAGYELTPMF